MATLGGTSRPAYVYDSGTDTWIPVGIGPHSHDPSAINAVASTTFDAKGDLLGGTGADTYTKLAVGNNGDTLLADSTQTTGLRWGNNLGFTAGKNKIINGDFNINQRGFSSTTTNETYGFDRWVMLKNDGTVTYSAQTFTPGTAPVAGYEGKSFARIVSSSQTSSLAYSILEQRIESVRTFAGQTITVSFWAKAASGTPKVSLEIPQNFGTGGSPSAGVDTYGGNVTLSTSWTRYSLTVAVPSIAGKTLGTTNDGGVYIRFFTSAGSDFNARTGSLGIQSNTIDFWGIQAEVGSVATAFQTATGTTQGELAACQRYFSNSDIGLVGVASSASKVVLAGYNGVLFRTSPTITVPSSLTNLVNEFFVSFRTPTAVTALATGSAITLECTGITGMTAGNACGYSSSTKLLISAEM